MSAVSIADAWPGWGEPFTVEDLERMPDDGRRYELIDGMLIVSPAPNMGHQRVIVVLSSLLEQACPENLVVFADIGVRIADNSALEPDVVVARVADAEGVRLARPPVLVVEVLSPHSVLRDLNLKKAAYERFGIPSYWVIDPDLNGPSLRGYELDGATYAEVAHVTGAEAFRASRPFDVEIVPDRLVAKLRRR
ncbi:MAG TPA: Uma2 family endonuclease [Streptosporangiaceae bacterium]|nr:Uma2 family endonuclease [Streptosporangiaceae bacterium]